MVGLEGSVCVGGRGGEGMRTLGQCVRHRRRWWAGPGGHGAQGCSVDTDLHPRSPPRKPFSTDGTSSLSGGAAAKSMSPCAILAAHSAGGLTVAAAAMPTLTPSSTAAPSKGTRESTTDLKCNCRFERVVVRAPPALLSDGRVAGWPGECRGKAMVQPRLEKRLLDDEGYADTLH